MLPPQQLDFPSLMFPKDRSVLTVSEVADRLRISDRHVIDLIEEGKLAAIDIAGRHDYIRVPEAALDDLARRFSLKRDDLLKIIAAHRPQLDRSRRAYHRIPREAYEAYLRQNHSLNLVIN